jgi:hypothetical protein
MTDLQCPATILLLSPETAALSDARDRHALRLSLVLFTAAQHAAAARELAAAHGSPSASSSSQTRTAGSKSRSSSRRIRWLRC